MVPVPSSMECHQLEWGKSQLVLGVVPAGDKVGVNSMLLSSTISLSELESLSSKEISTDILSDDSFSKES